MNDLRSRPIRIVLWNIRHGRALSGRGGWSDRRSTRGGAGLDAVARVLERERPDLVALCEVDFRSVRSGWVDQPAELGWRLGLEPVVARSRWFPLDRYGVALLVPRGSIAPGPSAVRRVRLPSIGEQRVVLIARLLLQGRPVTVAVTHLETDEQRRRQPQPQVELLAGVLSGESGAVSGGWGPRLVCGDFNLDADAAAALLAPSGLVVAASPPTYPSWEPTRRIDFVATDIPERVGEVMVGHSLISDHRPLIFTLS